MLDRHKRQGSPSRTGGVGGGGCDKKGAAVKAEPRAKLETLHTRLLGWTEGTTKAVFGDADPQGRPRGFSAVVAKVVGVKATTVDVG